MVNEVRSEIEAMEMKYGVEPVDQLNFGLVEVVYEWARAETFAKIMELTDVQEGIIVRCIQQLNDTLRDVKTAAMRIGETVLKEKMEEASTKIKRDIVFTASLYTQDWRFNQGNFNLGKITSAKKKHFFFNLLMEEIVDIFQKVNITRAS